jgi:outer membrane lipoprotein LolB
LVLFLAGCATPGLRQVDSLADLQTAAPLADFRLEGRLSARTPDRTVSGTLVWERGHGVDTLLLSGPLGQGGAEIRRESGRAELRTADGEHLVESSDARLMSRVLGFDLPLDGLLYWLSGQPQPDVAFRGGLDKGGHLAWLDQEGWHIEYERYALHGVRWLPGRIVARRDGEVDFRFVADRWEPR